MRNKQQREHVIAFILVGILIFNLFPLNLYAEGENTYDIVIKGGTIFDAPRGKPADSLFIEPSLFTVNLKD